MVVSVDPSADKSDLPRFRPPKVKALCPACLVLISMFTGSYNGEIEGSISLGFLVIDMRLSLAGKDFRDPALLLKGLGGLPAGDNLILITRNPSEIEPSISPL